MHLSSLSSPHGIGTMGQAARDLVDFLQAAGQSCWQLLPICPTSFGDSPYQSYSTYAGNPYFIDLDELQNMGLLEAADYENVDWESPADRVNYGAMYEKRYPILRKAAEKFLEQQSAEQQSAVGQRDDSLAHEYKWFCSENDFWLSDFALFMALKEVHGGRPWSEWASEYRTCDTNAIAWAKQEYAHEIEVVKVYQFLFWKQWWALKAYANEKGIEILGDLPIYVSMDSVDVWAHPELFQLDEGKNPIEVAGVPPDGFTAEGQLWGNPLYDWEYMEDTGYEWWVNRIHYLCNVYDILRIDHFRAFESYYVVRYGEKTAKNGVWKQGPGMKLFYAVEKKIGRQKIIAEDLGYLTEAVHQLLRDSGFPGMKVLEFAFDSRDDAGNVYLPHNYERNCVAYAGTHDNNTIVGWFEEISPEDAAYAREYLRISACEDSFWEDGLSEQHESQQESQKNSQQEQKKLRQELRQSTMDKRIQEEVCWEVIRVLHGSVADLVIIQAQDLLELGAEARMNTPSTLGENWKWRACDGMFSERLAKKLRGVTKLYGR